MPLKQGHILIYDVLNLKQNFCATQNVITNIKGNLFPFSTELIAILPGYPLVSSHFFIKLIPCLYLFVF